MKNTNFNRDDYYQILKVEENATLVEIQLNFKRLKKKYHPDRHTDPIEKKKYNERFLLVVEAYNVLSDEEQRKAYDVFIDKNIFNLQNKEHFSNSSIFENFVSKSNENNTYENSESHKDQLIVEQLLNNEEFCYYDTTEEGLFTQNIYRYTKNKKPSPFIYDINLTTNEMINGAVHVLNYTITRTCPHCLGNFQRRCSHCGNQRLVYVKKELYLRFPKHTQYNSQFIIKSKGYSRPDRKGLGDLIINVKHFDIDWKKEGKNYLYTHKISKDFAKTGGLSEIKYFNNKSIMINLPPKLKNGYRLILKNKGFVNEKEEPTDLIVKIAIQNQFFSNKIYLYIFIFMFFFLSLFLLNN